MKYGLIRRVNEIAFPGIQLGLVMFAWQARPSMETVEK